MRLRTITESIFTSSMDEMVNSAVTGLQTLMHGGNYEEFEELANSEIQDQYENTKHVIIGVEFTDSEDDHLEAMTYQDGQEYHIEIMINPEIETSLQSIKKLIGHELIHVVDKGPYAPELKAGERMDKYWEHPSESNAEISSFVHFALQELLQNYPKETIRTSITKPRFVEAIINKFLDEWEETFGHRQGHLNHYLNNSRFKKKILQHFARLIDAL